MCTTKKIAIVGSVGIPANYGGFETFVDYMSQYVSNKFDLTVYCSSKSYKEKMNRYNKARLKYIPLKATGIQSIPYDILSILFSLKNSDVILVLGSSGAIVLPFVRIFANKKVIFNMAGLEWQRSKWDAIARWFLKFSEKIAVKYSDEVVVDNQGLQEYILAEYGVKSGVIAYGGDQVSKLALTDELLADFPFLNKPYYCAIARIQPDNNVDIVLATFGKMPNRDLVFVGNWEGSDYGKELKKKYADSDNIHLLDAIYDLLILDQIRTNCVAYIHGHSSGGTNPSLVEAMHLELPIFAFDVNFNRYTTQNQAEYFTTSSELEEMVQHLDPQTLKNQTIKMKAMANDLYTWRRIVGEYEKLF